MPGHFAPTSIDDVMKAGPHTCCDKGFACSPGGSFEGDARSREKNFWEKDPEQENGLVDPRKWKNDPYKYWTCKPRAEALVAFEAWDILNKPEPEEPPITPCVNDPEGTRKNKKGELVGDHFCDKRVKKCMTHPWLANLCPKTCKLCTAPPGPVVHVPPAVCKDAPMKRNNKGQMVPKKNSKMFCARKAGKHDGKACAKKKFRASCCATCEETTSTWCKNGMIYRSYGAHHYHSLREEYMDKQLKGLMKEEWGAEGAMFPFPPPEGAPADFYKGMMAACVCGTHSIAAGLVNDDVKPTWQPEYNYACEGEACFSAPEDLGPEAVTFYAASCTDCTCVKDPKSYVPINEIATYVEEATP